MACLPQTGSLALGAQKRIGSGRSGSFTLTSWPSRTKSFIGEYKPESVLNGKEPVATDWRESQLPYDEFTQSTYQKPPNADRGG